MGVEFALTWRYASSSPSGRNPGSAGALARSFGKPGLAPPARAALRGASPKSSLRMEKVFPRGA